MNILRSVYNMRLNREQFLLYAVTESDKSGLPLSAQVENALKGGVTLLQLREKNLSDDEFLRSALEIKEVCRGYGVPLIINDNVTVARLSGADGVHLGQDDMSPAEARKILGADKVIGVSAHNAAEAAEAERSGADYLGSGAVFPTSTKSDVTALSYDELKRICESVKIPVVAIGGIGMNNIAKLKDSGIAGVAVSAAVFANSDITTAAKELKEKAENVRTL